MREEEEKYGWDDKLFCFSYRGGLGDIGAAVAPDAKTAFIRLCHDLRRLRHYAVLRRLLVARKRGMLGKVFKVRVVPLDPPQVHRPVQPPNG